MCGHGWATGPDAARALARACPRRRADYVGDPTPSITARAKCVFLNFLNVGTRKVSHEAVVLAEAPSPYVKSLMVTSKEGTRPGTKPLAPGKSGPLVIGTIRMGFGHHRIAYALSLIHI